MRFKPPVDAGGDMNAALSLLPLLKVAAAIFGNNMFHAKK